MKRKLLSLLLALAMVFACAVPAFAAGANTAQSRLAKLNQATLSSLTEKLKTAALDLPDMDAAVEKANAILAAAYGKLGVTAPALLQKAGGKTVKTAHASRVEPKLLAAGDAVTPASLIDIMSKYVFVRIDNAGDIAALIANSSDFTYDVVTDGRGTVYIRVDIEKNPQIFNYAVFRNLVEDLYAKQGEEMLKNADGSADYLMSYEHIAGELALHALVYALTSGALRLTGNRGDRLISLYRSAKEAELNYNESRLPAPMIAFFGKVLMNTLQYRVMSAFGLI